MSLRGIYDGGGVRKQNGHYQSSSLRGPINPDGTLLETHVIYELDPEGHEAFLEPYIFDHNEEDPNKQITLDAGARIRYRFKCVHRDVYRYSPTIETSIYRWSGFLDNFYIGRPGDFYIDLGVRYVKAAWSIYPDRYHPPGWIDLHASRDSNYQFQTGVWGGFLGWIAYGAELNYYDDTVTSQYGYGKLYLWEVQDTTTEAIDTVGIRYLGISAEVTAGYNVLDLDSFGKVLFQGTGVSGGYPVPLLTDEHCLSGKFDIVICNESGSSKTLEIAPVKFNQQELEPLPGTNSISNAEGNSTYLQVYEKRL